MLEFKVCTCGGCMGSEVKGDEHAEGPIRICKACLGCRSKSLGQRLKVPTRLCCCA